MKFKKSHWKIVSHMKKISCDITCEKIILLRRCSDMDEEEYTETQHRLEGPSELYLTALREYNRREVLLKRLMRRKNFKNIKMGAYFDILNELVDAQTEDEIDHILKKIDKSKTTRASMR